MEDVLEVPPLRMIPPDESASNSGYVSDTDSPQVLASSGLPPGWIVENRMKSNGSLYKVYIDPDTGMKFYSRVKVLDYLKNATLHRPPNKRRRLHMTNTALDQTNTSLDHHSPLPSGWAVEIKVKMSGRTEGKRYKVYVQKSTGKKFYSKREVLDYLKTSRSTSPEIVNVQSVRSDNHPDWSPQCWSMQNKNEIFANDSIAEEKAKVTDTNREETNVEGLPPDWFKAIRYRESRDGTRTKVAFYVDPMSGYAFFSTKDAWRYIDCGHIEDCRIKPKIWNEVSKDAPGNNFHSQPTTDERELKQEGRKTLFTEETCEGEADEDMIIEIKDSDEENEPLPKERIETKPPFTEENFKKNLEDATETDGIPIQKTGTEEKEKEKMSATSPRGNLRVKVLASKARPFLSCSKSTSSNPLTSQPEN